MKRPLFFASIVITAIIFLYLEIHISDHLMDYSDGFDGSNLCLSGYVSAKEFKAAYGGEYIPIVYITPVNAKIGKNKYIMLYMNAEGYDEPKIGEFIKVSGRVRLFSPARNPGEFDSSLYYGSLKIAYSLRGVSISARSGKYNFLREGLYRLKMRLEEILDICLGKDDAAIMKAMLLGDKAFLDADTKEMYKSCGCAHALCISGLHISLLGMGLFRLIRRCRIKVMPAAMASIAFMYMYGIMCGMSSSAFRAITMFLLRMLAPLVKRTADMLTSLSVAGLMLLIDQPLLLYNSGFLFSFGAIIGIGFLYPALGLLYKGKKDVKMHFFDDPEEPLAIRALKKFGDYLKVSLAIFLMTLPVYMSYYYTYPIFSVLINMIILPAMAPLMVMGLGCILAGSLSCFIGGLFGAVVHIILSGFELICNTGKLIPGGTWYMGHAGKWEIALYLFSLLMFSAAPELLTDINRHLRKCKSKKTLEKYMKLADVIRYAAVAVSLFALLWNPVRGLSITMMDVDQGDGILIRTPGEAILIDGGSTGKKNVGKYVVMPYIQYQGIGELDACIVTHEDEDHISGLLEIMDDMENGGIRIKNLVLPDVSVASRGDNYKKLETKAKRLGIPVSFVSCGQKLRFKDIEFTCLNPEKNMVTEGANAYSTVLHMRYGDFTALFTGDVEKEGEQHLLEDLRTQPQKYGNLTLLKVAHHGSKYTTCEEFLGYLDPKLAIISCGRDNSYGHPHKELVERLVSAGTSIYRTDEKGAIELQVIGNKVRINTMLSDK